MIPKLHDVLIIRTPTKCNNNPEMQHAQEWPKMIPNCLMF